MYIEPNSTVILLHGVPLDNRYEHTICWDDYTTAAGKEAQYNYFNNPARRLQILTKQTYQRYDRSYIKVAIPTDNLYNCNYMMFQNTSYGNKWFYAFVTNVSYINGNGTTGTTLIEYEIDRMQTWYFDYELMQCFVEREHSATDEVGDNIVDEGLNTGDYYYKLQKEFKYDDYYYLITYIPNEYKFLYKYDDDIAHIITAEMYEDYEQDRGYFTALNSNEKNIYASAGLKIVIDCGIDNRPPVTARKGINCVRHFITNLIDANCQIVSIQIVPKTFVIAMIHEDYYLYEATINDTGHTTTTGWVTNSDVALPIYSYQLQRENKFYDNNNEYIPKNKKLLTSPYLGVEVRTSQNDSVQLDYKFSDNFNLGIINFDVTVSLLPEYKVTLTPKNFNGQRINYNYSVSLDKFPYISFSTDSYNQWLNINKSAIATRLISTGIKAAGMVAAAYTGGSSAMAANVIAAEYSSYKGRAKHRAVNKAVHVGEELREGQTTQAGINAGVSAASDILEVIGDISRAKNMRDSYTDNANNPELAHFHEDDYIQIYQMGIFPQIARIIDSYFTRFGYATKITKVPNRRVRTHFCYTKTVGCEINGELPQSERDIICNVYDHGITFWKNPAEIGDFSIDNPPM